MKKQLDVSNMPLEKHTNERNKNPSHSSNKIIKCWEINLRNVRDRSSLRRPSRWRSFSAVYQWSYDRKEKGWSPSWMMKHFCAQVPHVSPSHDLLNSTEQWYIISYRVGQQGGKMNFQRTATQSTCHEIYPQWLYCLVEFHLVKLVLNMILNGVNIQTSVKAQMW